MHLRLHLIAHHSHLVIKLLLLLLLKPNGINHLLKRLISKGGTLVHGDLTGEEALQILFILHHVLHLLLVQQMLMQVSLVRVQQLARIVLA
jgi:hypothetical protein